jgi:hypothetical protein
MQHDLPSPETTSPVSQENSCPTIEVSVSTLHLGDSPIQAAVNALKSSDEFALQKARAILLVYDEVWRKKIEDNFVVVDVEKEFRFDLLNPDTSGKSRSFVEGGKFDVLVRRKDRNALVVIEHKTAADDISEGSDYWDRLRMDTQVSKYFLAATQMGEEVEGVLYDAVKKTAHRPKDIPELCDDGKKIVLDSNGDRVFLKNGEPRQTADEEKGWKLKSRPETPYEYGCRIHAIYKENANDLFKSQMIYRSDTDTLEYMRDAFALTQQIIYARSKNLWPRNPGACMEFGRCEYFDLCCGRASVDGIRYKETNVFNPELSIPVTDDRQILTKSRCSALRKCPRYHKLKYEDTVVRLGEESDALAFGTLYHQGLEAYYNAIKTIQSSPASNTFCNKGDN